MIFFVFTSLISSMAFAYETIPANKTVDIISKRVLVSTHSARHSNWDYALSSKVGLDTATQKVKATGDSTYYIVESSPEFAIAGYGGYFWADKNPTGFISASTQGEYMATFQASQIIWTGGYFESCSAASVGKTLSAIADHPQNVPEFVYVMDGLYTSCPDLLHMTIISPDAQFFYGNWVTNNLSQCLSSISDKDRLQYIEIYLTQVIPLRIKEMLESNYYKPFYPALPPIEKFTFKIYYKNTYLGVVGSGPIIQKLSFVDSADIK